MALQGFDKNYFLPQALAVLQEQDPDTWRGQNAAYLEEQLAVYNFTPQDLYEMWGWKYDLAPNRYFDPDYYMLALSKWAVDNKVPGCDNMTQAKAAVASALSGQDPYMHYLQYGTSMNINPSAAFDQSSYLENLLAWAKTAGHVGAEMTVAEVQEYFNQNGLSALGNYIDAGILVNIPVVPVPAGEIVTENASAIKVVDSLGTSSAHAVIDADGKDFIFKDDAAIQNFVAIEHFAKGDSILISNASASIYSISASGSDAVISYNNTAMGIVNEIILKGVLTDPSVLVSSEADLNKVLGFDAISDSGSITPVGTPQNADVGTITSVVTLSAAGDNFVFTDDAKVANGVLITGFEKGDSILVSNATASDYGVSVGAGGDAVISYNNTALNVVNEITLDGVIADPTVIISTPAELNAALGYNAITFA